MATTTELSISAARFLRLLAWTSPNYPVGAFSYSHGIEFAVEEGLIPDRKSFVAWTMGVLRHGTGHLDAELFRAAWCAVTAGDRDRLAEVAEWASALRGTSELALESAATGEAFARTLRKTTESPELSDWLSTATEKEGGMLQYPVAVAIAAATEAVPLEASLAAYLHAFSANLVSAALRLIPLGQTDGQIALLSLERCILEVVAEALERGDDGFDFQAIGTSTVMVDWCSMRHETQYTRLFRS